MRKLYKYISKHILTAFLLTLLIANVSYSQKIPKSYNIQSGALSTLDTTPKSNTVEKVLLAGDTVWIATSKGLSKSTDGGNNWYNYYTSTEFGYESASAIACAHGILCVATWHYSTTSSGVYATGSGLKISSDYGKTWTLIDQMIDSLNDTLIIYGNNTISALPISTEIQNFIRDIAITSDAIWVVSNSAGLRKSTDMGATWQRVVLPPDNLDSIKPTDNLSFKLRPKSGSVGNLNHIGFSILAVDDDTLYVGTAGGINKSTDGGVSWTKFSRQNQDYPISGNHILKIRQNPIDKTIWAATWKADEDEEYWGVSHTANGGKTWTTSLNDSRTLDFTFPEIISGSDVTADVIAVTQDGLFRTSNNGVSWLRSSQVYDNQRNITLLTDTFLSGAADNSSSSITKLWFGSTDGLVKLTLSSSSFWDGDWSIFLVSAALNSSTETYAFPSPFSPSVSSTRIKYSLTSASNVTIRIFDFGMNLVKTLIQNSSRNAGENYEAWNGRDDASSFAPNGVYFYRIDINDGKPLFGKIMVVR